MAEFAGGFIRLGKVSEIRQQIDRLRNEANSPTESALLDICEELAELINQLAIRQLVK